MDRLNKYFRTSADRFVVGPRGKRHSSIASIALNVRASSVMIVILLHGNEFTTASAYPSCANVRKKLLPPTMCPAPRAYHDVAGPLMCEPLGSETHSVTITTSPVLTSGHMRILVDYGKLSIASTASPIFTNLSMLFSVSCRKRFPTMAA